MPLDWYTAGDTCYCNVIVCNASDETMADIPVFVILDVYGMLFFAPDFSEFNFYLQPLPPGETVIPVLPAFPWPANTGTAANIYWYAAMTDAAIQNLHGDFDMFTFGWDS